MEQSLDLVRLNELIQDTDAETVVMVVDMIAESFEENVAKIRSLLEQGKATDAARTVHSMKSSIASVGGTSFWEVANQLEEKLTGSDPQQCSEQIEHFYRVSEEFEGKILPAIKAHLEAQC